MTNRGILIVVSGFSGAGKGTIVDQVCRADESFVVSVSATTRSPREGEVDGVHYFFVEDARFREMIAAGELLEHASYREHFYGTPAAYVDEMLTAGKHVILEIEVQGAAQIKKMIPEALLIFVTPPNIAVLEERLRSRGTETEEEILGRLSRAGEEIDYVKDYDYLLINDDLDAAVQDFFEIVNTAQKEQRRNTELIDMLRTQLSQIQEGV